MEDKNALEIRLLEAQIANLERQNKRGLLREAMPSLWAIAFSIVASLVVIAIGEMVVNNAIKKLNQVDLDITKKRELIADLTRQYNELSALVSTLGGRAMLYDLGVEFEIGIEKEGNAHVIRASSRSPDVRFRCFDLCRNSFVFPGEVPNTSVCQEIEGRCSKENNKNSCKFGPFTITAIDEGMWVSADLNGKTVYRYVHIRNQ